MGHARIPEEGTLNKLPETCDPRRLGLDPTNITQVKCIHRKHGSRLYRVECGGRSFVLKWFSDPAQAIEVRSYALLEKHGVPTLPVHGRTESALLLEDLTASPIGRLAQEADVERPETGVAVAEWYQTLHAAGREIVADPSGMPDFLGREVDALDASTVMEIGKKLGLSANPVWQLAADCIEPLKQAMRSFPETLNYNDFHWTNLALSRGQGSSVRAVVYDYHLLGIGLAYSDCRNVVGSLSEQAGSAFREAYGPVDEREALLDAPVSFLYALSVAVQGPRFPRWANGCLREVKCGGLENSLRRALEML